MSATPKTTRTAFTLVEILIVVVILAIVAAIALPRFSNASAAAKASMLAEDLRVFRVQVGVYQVQHRDRSPGYPVGGGDPTEAQFVAHMTLASNQAGQTAAFGTPGFTCGPYFREIPVNCINGKNSVLVLADGAALPEAATDDYGWIYQPSTGTILADAVGADERGKAYFDY